MHSQETIMFHAFFVKEIWKLLMKNENRKFVQTFADLSLLNSATDEIKASLEEFVCLMYGNKNSKRVDEVCAKMFHGKFSAGKMYVDLMLLPPCSSNLQLHIDRASYVANLFTESKWLMMLLDDPEEHGWGKKGLWNRPNYTSQMMWAACYYLTIITKCPKMMSLYVTMVNNDSEYSDSNED